MTKSNDGPRAAGVLDELLGQRIRVLRHEKDMSQQGLAEAIGVTFQQVQKYEKGVNRVGANRLQQIATALGVPVTAFYSTDTKKGQAEVQSLLFSDTKFSLRLLRAYSAIEDVQFKRSFVTLLEHAAGIRAEEE